MFRRFTSATQQPKSMMMSSCAFSSKRFMATPEAFQCLAVAKVGEPAPNFSVEAYHQGKVVEKMGLSNFAGKKVLLLFYPLDFTFVCPTEILAFNDRHSEFEKLNAQVVAVSVDSVFSHKAWDNTPRKKGGIEGMKIPMLSDMTKDLSRDYGVLIEEKGIALRGLFVLDENHLLQSATVNNLPIGRSVDEALRVCEAIDAAKDGNVAPCGWTPGKPLLKVSEADKFFESQN